MKKVFLRGLGVITALLLVVGCGGGTKISAKTSSSTKSEESEYTFTQKVASAYRQSDTLVEVKMKYDDAKSYAYTLEVWDYETKSSNVLVDKQPGKKKGEYVLTTTPLDPAKNYLVAVISTTKDGVATNTFEIQPGDSWLNRFSSDKPLGCTISGKNYTFRVFAPRATRVVLALFDQPYEGPAEAEKQPGEKQIEMTRDANGVWEVTLTGNYLGKFYGYRVWGPKGDTEDFNPKVIVADPYSKALATKQVSPQHHLTVIVDPSTYRWTSKEAYMPYKQHELIVYEMHVRDMTMLSKNITKKGTYEGLVEDGKEGGLGYLKELGVNAVELLPTQEFNEIEAPYMVRSPGIVYNNWNVYGRNHWGYMTSCYFAPEAFYFEGEVKPGKWIGTTGAQVYAFKSMVDAFHKNGIAVLMDVVYNHVSQYDRNALKYIDKKYYFFMNELGSYDSRSGCGNDYKSDRPMSSRLIVDSTVYWVKEYRVDGYRFDLGTIIDWKTYETLVPAVRAINPNAVFTAEPWMGGRGEPRDGGGYALNEGNNGFDKRGIGAWNDKFRNLVRGGANATYGASAGLVFGNAPVAEMKKAVLGYPQLFKYVGNSFNYIESHDNNTFGDFLRLGNKDLKKDMALDVFTDGKFDVKKYLALCKLTDKQMKQAKLGALFLFTVPGALMMHEGQELARMKVVVPPTVKDVFPEGSGNWVKNEKGGWENAADGNKKWSSKPRPWVIDHDSYEKDNEANWIVWQLKDVNKELFEYYKGLIKMRRTYSAFSAGAGDKVQFFDARSEDGKSTLNSALGYLYPASVTGNKHSFLVLINGNFGKKALFTLPAGEWNVMVDETSASVQGKKVSGTVALDEMSGMVLYQ
jgi:pullulanase/glycogen debranching enzyme